MQQIVLDEHSEWLDMLKQTAQGIRNRFPELSMDAIMDMFRHSQMLQIPKKGVFIRRGQFDTRVAFVVKGLFRAFYKQDSGEYTIWFREEYDLFASHASILSGKPSTLTYQALEDSIIMVMDYPQLKDRAKMDQQMSVQIISILEGILLRLIESLENFIMMNPEERFQKIMERKSNLVNRVPQNQLASLLGITPESFSRLKGRLKQKEESQ
jgi:CRP-like cAMP-binding protein